MATRLPARTWIRPFLTALGLVPLAGRAVIQAAQKPRPAKEPSAKTLRGKNAASSFPAAIPPSKPPDDKEKAASNSAEMRTPKTQPDGALPTKATQEPVNPGSLEELNRLQQETLVLQAQLERDKVKRALDSVHGAGQGTSALILSNEEAASKQLKNPKLVLVYGPIATRRGVVAYEEGRLRSEVRVGDILPDGRTVVQVNESSLVLKRGSELSQLFLSS